MPDAQRAVIDQVRASSRRMVRSLGFMQATLAGTDHSPSAVHTLLELGQRRSMTAGEVAQLLGLDKSSVSRMLRKLVAAGEVEEACDPQDGRAKLLRLTAQGRGTRARIEAHARRQVRGALARLDAPAHDHVVTGLQAYAAALAGERAPVDMQRVRIVSGWRPGAVGLVTALHADYYAREVGFGAVFEGQVAAGLADFVQHLHGPRHALWTAWHGQQLVGSVAIDGGAVGSRSAHLRWFIVADGWRGHGIGRRLLRRALSFCDRQGFDSTFLWTFEGLGAARRLYEAAGFQLAEQHRGDRWGRAVMEQRFVRAAPVSVPVSARKHA